MQIIKPYFAHFKKNIDSRFIILQGSSRSGKTFSVLQWLFFLSLNRVKFEVTIVGRTIPFLRDGAVNTFKTIAPEHKVIKSPFSANIYNSNYLFRSFENEDDAKGSERDILYINECNDVNPKIVEQLIIRTRKQVILDYNPTKHFWVDDYITPTNFLKTTWQDNPYLSEAQKQHFEKIKERAESPTASAFDKYLYSVFYLGEYGNLRGNVFGRVSKCTLPEYELATKHSKKVYGLDFGFSVDPCALVEVSLVLNTIYIKQLIYKSELNDFDLSELLKLLVNREFPVVCDFGGGGDARMSNIFQLTGLTLIKATKGSGSVLHGVELLNSYSIVVCGEDAYREFTGYELKDGEFVDKDNHCFTGETMITTINGLVRIDEIKIGDLVLTSKGFKRVLKTFYNGIKQVNKYSMQTDTNLVNLCSTKEHKIKTNLEWREISKLKLGQTVTLCNHLTERNFIYTQKKDISQKVKNECTFMFMSFITERLKKVFIFTIKTAIVGIITLITWNVSKATSIYENTLKKGLKIIKNGLKNFTQKELKKLKNGINLKTENNGTQNTQKEFGKIQFLESVSVSNAETFLKQNTKESQNFAIITAKLKLLEKGESYYDKVYDLMIEDEHEYFANGILVHNCIDSSRYAFDYGIRAMAF